MYIREEYNTEREARGPNGTEHEFFSWFEILLQLLIVFAHFEFAPSILFKKVWHFHISKISQLN